MRGLTYSSAVDTCANPALLGALTSGPGLAFIDGGRLLWESDAVQVNGDFWKTGTDDPECPEPIKLPPTCVAGGNAMINLGDSLLFDASASSDPDGQIVSFHWSFGDGTSSALPTVQHTYLTVPLSPPFVAILTLTDNDGLVTQCTRTIFVNGPPLCDAGPAQIGQINQLVAFDGSASSDPGRHDRFVRLGTSAMAPGSCWTRVRTRRTCTRCRETTRSISRSWMTAGFQRRAARR